MILFFSWAGIIQSKKTLVWIMFILKIAINNLFWVKTLKWLYFKARLERKKLFFYFSTKFYFSWCSLYESRSEVDVPIEMISIWKERFMTGEKDVAIIGKNRVEK